MVEPTFASLWNPNFKALFGENVEPLYRWNFANPIGTTVIISFAFIDTFEQYAENLKNVYSNAEEIFIPIPSELRKIAQTAFTHISSFTKIQFIEVNDPKLADIAIGGTIYAGGQANNPPSGPPIKGIPEVFNTGIGDIYIGIGKRAISGPTDLYGDGSFVGFYDTFLHELGHALGLSHPQDYSSEDPVQHYAQIIDQQLENNLYTAMSYFHTGTNLYLKTMMPLDILALQYIYGKNNDTPNKENLITFDSENIGLFTIISYSELNTIDLSNQITGTNFDLRIGGISSVGITRFFGIEQSNVDVSIARNNVITGPDTNLKNIIGTPYDDIVTVNFLSNKIIGGGGSDTVLFSEQITAYDIYLVDGVTIVKSILRPDDVDSLFSIQKIAFSDVSLNYPVVSKYIPDQYVDINQFFVFTTPENAFRDADGDILNLTASLGDNTPLPAWLTFTADTRTFAGTPPTNFNGVLDLKVTASDGTLSASDTFTLTIGSVSDAPTVVNNITDQSAAEDTAISFIIPNNVFSDIDSEVLNYTASLGNNTPLPAWLTFTADTQTFAGMPPTNFNGMLDLKVTASDGTLSASNTFKLTIEPVNDAPVLANVIADQSAIEDAAFTFIVPVNAFSDIDGDPLTLMATLKDKSSLPIWLAFDPETRTFAGTVPRSVTGSLDVSVIASDGELSVSNMFKLIIKSVNDAPIITHPIHPLKVVAGRTVIFTIAASDPNGDELTYTVGAATKGMVTISGSQVSYTAAQFASGKDAFAVSVSDGLGGIATQMFDVEIASEQPTSDAFRLVLSDGWTGAVGGTGSLLGSNGVEDITLLSGALKLSGAFNKGGDIIRFSDEANNYFVGQSGTSTAVITNNSDIRVTIPVGIAGLFVNFDDGNRKLLFSEGFKLGMQTFNTDLAPITASDDGSILPALSSGAARATLVMFGGPLQSGQDAHVLIGGNVQVRGTNGVDIIKLADIGGDFIFDSSFNRGGDIIVLNREASAYSAARQGSSIVISSNDENLIIPVGTAGLMLQFTDGNRILIFQDGDFRIGDQTIAGSKPITLGGNAATVLLAEGGVFAQLDTFDGLDATSNYALTSLSFEMAHTNFG